MRVIPAIEPGYRRQWVRCRTCGHIAYYDYMPHSLSSPIMWLPCGHGLAERDMGADRIPADEALRALSGLAKEPQA